MVHFWQGRPRMKIDTAQAVASAPPVTVTGLTLFGVPLNEVVLVLTAIYTVVLIYTTVARHVREKKRDGSSAVLDR